MGRSFQRNLALSRQIDVRSRSRVMSVLPDMIGRGWENLLARPNGSLSLRFYVQPTMASLVRSACRHSGCEGGAAGLSVGDVDAPGEASAVAPRGLAGSDDAIPAWRSPRCIYQLMTVRFLYPLELLFTATLLALVPYALLRGPFNRLARLFLPAARTPRSNQPETTHSFD